MNSLVNSIAPARVVSRSTHGPLVPGLGQRLLRAFERAGQARAAQELERLARYYEPTDRELARQLRVVARRSGGPR